MAKLGRRITYNGQPYEALLDVVFHLGGGNRCTGCELPKCFIATCRDKETRLIWRKVANGDKTIDISGEE